MMTIFEYIRTSLNSKEVLLNVEDDFRSMMTTFDENVAISLDLALNKYR